MAQSSVLGGLLGHADMCWIAKETPLGAAFVSVVLRLKVAAGPPVVAASASAPARPKPKSTNAV